MADTIAELVFKLDGSDLQRSEKLLMEFAGAGEQAEQYVQDLGSSADTVFESLGQDLDLIRRRGQVFDNFETVPAKIYAVENALDQLLQRGLSPNDKAVKKLRAQYDGLQEQVRQTASATGKMNRGLGSSQGLLQSVGFLIQDAPFSIMTGNIVAVSNNIPMLVQQMQAFTTAQGGATAAMKAFIGSLASPAGAVILLGSILPSAILLAQSGLFDFGEEAEDTEDKLNRLQDAIKSYASTVSDIGRDDVFDPLGVVSGGREIQELENVQDRLQSLFDLREQLGKQEAISFRAGRLSGFGVVNTQQVETAASIDQLNAKITEQENLFGELSDTRAKDIQSLIDQRINTQKLNEAMVRLNPALKLQRDINSELAPAIRDYNLELTGSKQAIQGLLSSYDAQIEALRAQGQYYDQNGKALGIARDLTEQQRRQLSILTQAREKAADALDEQTESTRSYSDIVGDLNSELDLIADKSAVGIFGLDTAAANADAYRQAIEQALAIGVAPQSQQVQRLADKWYKAQVNIDGYVESVRKVRKVQTFDASSFNLADYWAESENAINNYRSEQEKVTDKQEELNRFGKDFGLTFTSSLEESIIKFNDLGSVVEGFFTDLQRLIIRTQITTPLFDKLFGKEGNSGLVGGFVSNLFGGGKATGGPVKKGKYYTVGEQGPELFAPSQNGTIIPNGNSGAVNVSLNVINKNGSEVKTNQRKTADGGLEIDLLIENKVKESFNDGRLDRVMSSNFNLNRSGY